MEMEQAIKCFRYKRHEMDGFYQLSGDVHPVDELLSAWTLEFLHCLIESPIFDDLMPHCNEYEAERLLNA